MINSRLALGNKLQKVRVANTSVASLNFFHVITPLVDNKMERNASEMEACQQPFFCPVEITAYGLLFWLSLPTILEWKQLF